MFLQDIKKKIGLKCPLLKVHVT